MLSLVAEHGHVQLVRFLLSEGASSSIPDKKVEDGSVLSDEGGETRGS